MKWREVGTSFYPDYSDNIKTTSLLLFWNSTLIKFTNLFRFPVHFGLFSFCGVMEFSFVCTHNYSFRAYTLPWPLKVLQSENSSPEKHSKGLVKNGPLAEKSFFQPKLEKSGWVIFHQKSNFGGSLITLVCQKLGQVKETLNCYFWISQIGFWPA